MAMDLFAAAKELRLMLISHDKTVKKLQQMDTYIDNIGRQQLLCDLDPCHENMSLQYLRLSTANGVRQMFDTYRIKQIQRVQKLSQSISETITGDDTPLVHQTTSETMTTPITMDTAASNYTNNTRVWFRVD